MRHLTAWVAAIGHTHAVSRPAAPALPPYAALYATCATLMIAVLVVFYFDRRVRDHLTARQRGRAIGSLGGFIGTGLLVCLFALAGLIADTEPIRIFITIYTLAFLVFTFGAAISAWGREDAARLRQARTPRVAVPPVPIPRGAATERERAAELFAAALFILGQTQPAAVMAALERNSPAAELERLRLLTDQWMTFQPELIAVGAWYPSAEVRETVAPFVVAGQEALKQTGFLFADKETLLDEAAKVQWRAKADAAYEAFDNAWKAFVVALNQPEAPENGHMHGRRRTSPSQS